MGRKAKGRDGKGRARGRAGSRSCMGMFAEECRENICTGNDGCGYCKYECCGALGGITCTAAIIGCA